MVYLRYIVIFVIRILHSTSFTSLLNSILIKCQARYVDHIPLALIFYVQYE